jgi:hypothetical protein
VFLPGHCARSDDMVSQNAKELLMHLVLIAQGPFLLRVVSKVIKSQRLKRRILQ